jgi:ferric-dicitrate binding protein FerR (iron transport regulator)
MKEYNWELIAKYLANETNPEEELEFRQLLDTDHEFKQEFEASKSTWNRIKLPSQTFDKNRIQDLRDQKIKQAQLRKIVRSTMKYAAAFIAFAMISLFIYNDLNSTITIVADSDNKMEITLPDGSVVMMKKDAQISYSNSILRDFDRKIKLQGQAFFEITKAHGKNFIVETNEYNIEVLGTKFNVNSNKDATSVVLTEGKVALNNFRNPQIANAELIPGQMAFLNHSNQQLTISNVNTAIYTTWTQNKIDFDNFSISELGEIFKIHYHKTLVIDPSISLNNKVGGSAPTDDLDLIIKGLSIVLKREITQQNDTIYIK